MGMPVMIGYTLYEQARIEARAKHRTIAGQVEYWAQLGRAALDNPNLPANFVAETLASLREPRDQDTVPHSHKG
jgi:ParD-like antitoxin of type II bacterial toxin-antitoxin system